MSKKRILVACSMVENELKRILSEMPASAEGLDVKWMDRGLHSYPEDLQEKLQETIDALQDYDEIIMAYGLCGNGTAGLHSDKATLVIPRFDDCINMLLCVGKRKSRGLVEAGNLYLTEGWINDEESLLPKVREYEEMYGDDEDMLEAIIEGLYGNYKYLTIIDTGCYDLNLVKDYSEEASEKLDLEIRTVPGTNRILEQLVAGEYDSNFIILNPGEVLTYSHFDLP